MASPNPRQPGSAGATESGPQAAALSSATTAATTSTATSSSSSATTTAVSAAAPPPAPPPLLLQRRITVVLPAAAGDAIPPTWRAVSPPLSPPRRLPARRSAVAELTADAAAVVRNAAALAFRAVRLTPLNTRGGLTLLLLYLLRYPPVFRFAQRLGLSLTFFFLVAANFPLASDLPTQVRGMTLGVSRLLVLLLCWRSARRLPRAQVPFWTFVGARSLPYATYLLSRAIYGALATVLRVARGSDPLPPSSPFSVRDASSSCCICLDPGCDYAPPCGHLFHRGCLVSWIAVKPQCPLCQTPIRVSNGAMAARRLQDYFVLDLEEWLEEHGGGEWWHEPILPLPPPTAAVVAPRRR